MDHWLVGYWLVVRLVVWLFGCSVGGCLIGCSIGVWLVVLLVGGFSSSHSATWICTNDFRIQIRMHPKVKVPFLFRRWFNMFQSNSCALYVP